MLFLTFKKCQFQKSIFEQSPSTSGAEAAAAVRRINNAFVEGTTTVNAVDRCFVRFATKKKDADIKDNPRSISEESVVLAAVREDPEATTWTRIYQSTVVSSLQALGYGVLTRWIRMS